MNIIAHWSMNDPTILRSRFWDNSGNKHHGDYGSVKPAVVTDSPNGTKAMEWSVGSKAVVSIPTISDSIAAISFYVKKLTGCTVDFPQIEDNDWHSVVVSDEKIYIDGVEKGTQSVSALVDVLKDAMNGKEGFVLSDLYFYGEALTAAEIEKIVYVKVSISKGRGLLCKEFVEETDANARFTKSGVVTADSLDATLEDTKTSIKQQKQVLTTNVEEI